MSSLAPITIHTFQHAEILSDYWLHCRSWRKQDDIHEVFADRLAQYADSAVCSYHQPRFDGGAQVVYLQSISFSRGRYRHSQCFWDCTGSSRKLGSQEQAANDESSSDWVNSADLIEDAVRMLQTSYASTGRGGLHASSDLQCLEIESQINSDGESPGTIRIAISL